MTTKYFFAATGEYLGGFNEGAIAEVPADAIEVQTPPEHGFDRLVNGVIVPFVPPVDPLQALEQLISQGQAVMASDPLPADIQAQIFNLEVFVQNYYKRNALELIKGAIAQFTIPEARTDVTPTQRAQVEALKTQMLGVFA